MAADLQKFNPGVPVAQAGIPATRAWLESRIGMLEAVAPPGTPVRQIVALAVGEIVDTPNLQKCTPISVLRCAMVAAELRLSFGKVTGELYPVPYDRTCTPIVGYKGMLRLIRRDPKVANVYAEVVYEGDRFEVVRGTEPNLVHVPDLNADRADAKIVAAYAVIRFTDGTSDFEYMTRAELDKTRKASRAGQNGPWVAWYPDMCEKSALRKLYKRHQWANDDVAKAAVLEAHDAGETISGAFESDVLLESIASEQAEPATTRPRAAKPEPEPVEADWDAEPLLVAPSPAAGLTGKSAFIALCKQAQRDTSSDVVLRKHLIALVPEVMDGKAKIDDLSEADWSYACKVASETWGVSK